MLSAVARERQANTPQAGEAMATTHFFMEGALRLSRVTRFRMNVQRMERVFPSAHRGEKVPEGG
jgi:hypothetical protein